MGILRALTEKYLYTVNEVGSSYVKRGVFPMPDKADNKIGTKEVVIFAVVLLAAIVLYFLLFSNAGKKEGTHIVTQPNTPPPTQQPATPPSAPPSAPSSPPETGGTDMTKQVNQTAAPAPPKEIPTKIFVPTATYSKSKGTVAVNVSNLADKDVMLEKITLVYGTPPEYKTYDEFQTVLSTLPSKSINVLLKQRESRNFVVDVKELPTEVWAVPADHTAVAGIIQAYIKVQP